MADIAFVVRLRNGTQNPRVVDLLHRVQIVTSGYSCRVVMGKIFVMLANRLNQVPFHDLHMVNIIEQLDARGIY